MPETTSEQTSEAIAIVIIEYMEHAKIGMETLRTNAKDNGWNAHALSIAMTELETSQLWLANARHRCEINEGAIVRN